MNIIINYSDINSIVVPVYLTQNLFMDHKILINCQALALKFPLDMNRFFGVHMEDS